MSRVVLGKGGGTFRKIRGDFISLPKEGLDLGTRGGKIKLRDRSSLLSEKKQILDLVAYRRYFSNERKEGAGRKRQILSFTEKGELTKREGEASEGDHLEGRETFGGAKGG